MKIPIFVHPTSDKSHVNLHIVMAEANSPNNVTLCGIKITTKEWDAHMLDPFNITNPVYEQMCKTCANEALTNHRAPDL